MARNRITSLSFEKRIEVCDFIKANRSNKELVAMLHDTYGLDYSEQSIGHIKKMANYKENLEHLQHDEEIMNRWRKEIESIEKVSYADMLDMVFNKQLDPQQFEQIQETEANRVEMFTK